MRYRLAEPEIQKQTNTLLSQASVYQPGHSMCNCSNMSRNLLSTFCFDNILYTAFSMVLLPITFPIRTNYYGNTFKMPYT